MDRSESYFVRLPVPRGTRGDTTETYVEVVPDLLYPGLMTEIWQKHRGDSHDTKVRWVRAHGVVPEVKRVDTSRVTNRIGDLVEQLGVVTAGAQSDGQEFASDVTSVFADFTQVIELVAQGHYGTAADTVDGIGYALMSVVSETVEKLTRLQTYAASQEQLSVSLVDALSTMDERSDDEATRLALEIEDGLRIIDDVVNFEAELEVLYNELVSKTRRWAAFTAGDSNWLSEKLLWFDDPSNGFGRRVSQYLMQPDSIGRESMLAYVAEAWKRLDLIEERAQVAQSEHVEVLPKVHELLSRLADFESSLRKLREYRDSIAKSTIGGLDAFTVVKGLVNEAELKRWNELQNDPHWESTFEIGNRLRTSCGAIRGMLTQEPKFDERATRAIKNARADMERVAPSLADPEVPSVPPSEDVAKTATAVPRPRPTAPPSLTAKTAVEVRLLQVYDLVLMVAAVRYCGRSPSLMATPKSLLGILLELNLVSDEESVQFRKPIESLMQAKSVFVDKGESRADAWQNTRPERAHWIMFRQKLGGAAVPTALWRLVAAHREEGFGKLAEHGLSIADVEDAYTVFNQKRLNAYQENRKK